jgi:hypothetical protein
MLEYPVQECACSLSSDGAADSFLKQKPDSKVAIAAFCRLIFLQLPSDQADMAEACGSRTHHSAREEPNHRL